MKSHWKRNKKVWRQVGRNRTDKQDEFHYFASRYNHPFRMYIRKEVPWVKKLSLQEVPPRKSAMHCLYIHYLTIW